MLELTEQQEKERLNKKIAAFREGLSKLEKETGMTMIAVLQPSLMSLSAKLQIVEIPPETKKNENT